MKSWIFSILIITLISSCNEIKQDKSHSQIKDSIINPDLSSRPNILWIVAEDLSAYIPSFGDSTIVTPHLSKLAEEGVCYDNFYAPHPVCATARAAIITGMYANSIGASHMRTGPWFGGKITKENLKNYQKAMPENIRPYEAVPPDHVKMFTEYLRSSGYYCSNNSKEDYQFIKTPMAWDDSGNKAHWRNRPDGAPFFSVFNINVTHESQIWKKQHDSLWMDEQVEIPIPPYLPNTEIAKKDVRRMYSNIIEMDAKVGILLRELEDDGLLENTIVFWYTDHGGPLPRQKRLLYDSGIKVPMIIRYPNKQYQGLRDERMISFIDLAPTLLSLSGIKAPDYMQGKAFLGKYMRSIEPNYVFSAADRFDETTDRIRAVRDKRFKYIKYYEPEKSMYLEVGYRNQMPIMQELLRLKKDGKLSPEQALWFRETKPDEELFDLKNDPYELHNLAQNEQYKEKLDEMRMACNEWTANINDTGLISEDILINQMWPDKIQPKTEEPTISLNGEQVTLNCSSQGASIGYKIVKKDMDPKSLNWQVYHKSFILRTDEKLMVIAHRLGYAPSQIIEKVGK